MSDRRNLLAETLERMAEHGKTTGDVRFVRAPSSGMGDGWYWATWDVFAQEANIEYDAGWGGNEIPLGLMVVGDDWWMERHEYDGSEWWEFKALPRRPDEQRDTMIVLDDDLPWRPVTPVADAPGEVR